MRVFFFNDTATTEIYTLSLHDALPISQPQVGGDARPMVRPADLARYAGPPGPETERVPEAAPGLRRDRKSTRLNSSHGYISYAVFCLKKKKQSKRRQRCVPSASRHSAS